MSRDRYIFLNGEKIFVTEEVYRAYYRPVWREIKQKEVRKRREYSLDALADAGFEIASDEVLVDEIVADKLLLDELYAALDELTDDELKLIYATFFKEKSERAIASERDVQRNTVVYHKNKILDKLRKILENL